jgi:hypothetical protein
MRAHGRGAHPQELRSVVRAEPPVDDAQQEADVLVCRHGCGCSAGMAVRGESVVELFNDVGGETAAMVAGAKGASN